MKCLFRCDLNEGLINEISGGCRNQLDWRRREEARGYCRCMDRAAHADVENWNCAQMTGEKLEY